MWKHKIAYKYPIALWSSLNYRATKPKTTILWHTYLSSTFFRGLNADILYAMLLSRKHYSCCSKTSKSHLLPIIFLRLVTQWNVLNLILALFSTQSLVKSSRSNQKKFKLHMVEKCNVFVSCEPPSWMFGFAPGPLLRDLYWTND